MRKFFRPKLKPLLLPILAAVYGIPAFASLANFSLPEQDFSRLSLSGNYYLTDTNQKQTSDIYRSNFSLSGAWRGSTSGSFLDASAFAEASLGLNKRQTTFLNLREAYLHKKITPWLGATLGRKMLDWNYLDQEFSLGLYQPRFRWDYLDSRINGLVGGFVHLGNGQTWQFDAYASPIFIPDQGAPFEIANGTCTTSSPWFKCPASSISLFNQSTNVNFNLEIPPIRKIIAYGGGGATLWLKDDSGFWFRSAYAYKPINQFLLSYEGVLSLAQSTPSLPATIRPRVLYHELIGGDLGWLNEDLAFTGSVISENVIRDYTPPNWNTQETVDATFYGGSAKLILSRENPQMPVVGKISFFQRHGGNADDRGPFASSNGSVFEQRFAFEQLFIFEIETPLPIAKNFSNRTRLLWETKTEGNLLSSDISWKAEKNWLASIGIDIIGTKNNSPIEFFSRFQRNDRIHGEVAYVF